MMACYMLPEKKQEREGPSEASTGDGSILGQLKKRHEKSCTTLACSIFPPKCDDKWLRKSGHKGQ